VCEYVDYVQSVDYRVKCWHFVNTIIYFPWKWALSLLAQ
jgi:hypothetical protein